MAADLRSKEGHGLEGWRSYMTKIHLESMYKMIIDYVG